MRADPDLGRQQAGQPPQGRPGGRRPALGRHVDVGDLAAGVHAGVGAAGHGERRAARAARSSRASASSTVCCTVGRPGCRAQPWNADPS